MLIRLCGHYPDNPNHIDKLISIKGLPDEWFFRNSRFGGKELVSPWEPDVEENIPDSIRHLCEEVEITQVFSPIEKGRDYVVDKKKISGLRFNYMTEPGQMLWEKIERFLDRMTPRDRKVPIPVLVAPNQKADFSPHEARRSVRGSLEMRRAEIPDVDLRIIPSTEATSSASVTTTLVVPAPVAKPVEEVTDFPCTQCAKVFEKKRALLMHVMKMHSQAKSPATVGA